MASSNFNPDTQTIDVLYQPSSSDPASGAHGIAEMDDAYSADIQAVQGGVIDVLGRVQDQQWHTAWVVKKGQRATGTDGSRLQCTVAGTTGSTEPTWPTSVGGTVADNGVTWQSMWAPAGIATTATVLTKADNLASVANPATARTNLGVPSAAGSPPNTTDSGGASPTASGAANVTAFNTAFNVASNNYEYIPAGTYPIASRLTGTGGRFKGAGRDKTVLQLAAGSTDLLWLVQNINNFELEHVTLDLNYTATANQGNVSSQMGLYVLATSQAMTQLAVRHVKVINGWHRGISIVGTAAYPISCDLYDIDIENCGQAVAAGDCGLYVVNATGFKADGVKLRNNKGQVSAGAAAFYDSTGFTIADMVATGNSGEGASFSTASTGCSNFRVIGGDFSNNQGNWGLAVSYGCTDFSLVGGRSNGNTGGGLAVDVQNGGGDTTFHDVESTVVGWRANSNVGNHGLWLNMLTGVDVVGGTFSNNGAAGVGAVAQKVKFLGFDANYNTTYGIALYVGSGVTTGGHTLGGNTAAGNTTAPIYDATGSPNTYLASGAATPGGTVDFLRADGTWAAPASSVSELPSPSVWGYQSVTLPPSLATATVTLTGGTLYLFRAELPAGSTINDVTFGVAAAGSGLTAGANAIGIYDPTSGSQLGATGDLSSDFAATGVYTAALTAAATVGSSGAVLVGILTAGTTPAKFTGAAAATLLNYGPSGVLATTSKRGASYSSGLTGLPSTVTISSIANSPQTVFAGLS